MRRLDTLRLRARSLASGLRRRLPGALDAVVGPPRPGALDLRVGLVRGLDAEDAPAPTVTATAARRATVAAVAAWGPLPVRVWTGDRPDAARWELVRALCRFSHRLDCPTTLVTDGHGLDADQALALVDGGLARVLVLVSTAEALEPAAHALRALTAAADARGVPLALTAWILAGPDAPPFAEAGTALSRAGAHEQAVVAGWRDRPVPALPADLPTVPPELPALLAAASGDGGPGLPGGTCCPVAHRRAALGPDGRFRACPHKAPLDGASLDEAWVTGQAHFAAVKACARRCPAPLLTGAS